VLNALKAALALEDQFVKNTFSCIQIRASDPVGVKQIELVGLGHLSGGHYLDLPRLNSTAPRERIWVWSKPREATNATRKEKTG
jgi:hypothetical protein